MKKSIYLFIVIFICSTYNNNVFSASTSSSSSISYFESLAKQQVQMAINKGDKVGLEDLLIRYGSAYPEVGKMIKGVLENIAKGISNERVEIKRFAEAEIETDVQTTTMPSTTITTTTTPTPSTTISTITTPSNTITSTTTTLIPRYAREYLTGTPKSEDYLRKILGHRSFHPKVFRSHGIPKVIIDEILSYLVIYGVLESLTECDYNDSPISLCLLSNGNLVSGSLDKTIKIWDLDDKCVQILKGHKSPVSSLCTLPNGNLASGSFDKTIKIWNPKTDHCFLTLTGHTHIVQSLCVLPNGNLASGSFDGTIKIWDTRNGNCLQTLNGHNNASIISICVLPNGNLASGAADRTIKIWNTETGHFRTLTGHNHYVSSLCVLPNGNLASGSWDKTIKIWNTETGNCLQTLPEDIYYITSLCLLPNGNLVSGTGSETIKIWDTSTYKCLATFTDQNRLYSSHIQAVNSLCVLPNGNLALCYNIDRRIRILSKIFDINLKQMEQHSSGTCVIL